MPVYGTGEPKMKSPGHRASVSGGMPNISSVIGVTSIRVSSITGNHLGISDTFGSFECVVCITPKKTCGKRVFGVKHFFCVDNFIGADAFAV